jgi:hypothetical protein
LSNGLGIKLVDNLQVRQLEKYEKLLTAGMSEIAIREQMKGTEQDKK